jgi:hypothetical protein
MFHIAKTLDDLDETIDNAIVNEAKKRKITKNLDARAVIDERKSILDSVLDETPEGKIKGIINYSKSALKDMNEAE